METRPAKCKLMNGDIFMHVKNSLAQVKDQYNLCIFCVKLVEKISTNVNHAGGNLPIYPMLCNSSLKSKNVPNFDDGAKCFDNISNKRNIYMNPQQELQNTLLIEGFLIKIYLI